MKLNWMYNEEVSGFTAEFAGGKVFDIVPCGPIWCIFYQRGPRRLLISVDCQLDGAKRAAEGTADALTSFTSTNPGRESNHA